MFVINWIVWKQPLLWEIIIKQLEKNMFNLPDRYKMDVKVALKDFIPSEIKPNDKKRIKDAVKEVRLVFQIAGEEIPSVVDSNYRCQAIQFFDIEVVDIKDAQFLASTYQNIIKPYCVIHMYDSKDEVYSFAVKRLNQQDETQIVIEESLVTEKYPVDLPDESRNRLLAYMDYLTVKNKQDKVALYKEWYSKAYILANEKAYEQTQLILDGNFWYDTDRTARVLCKYAELVNARASLKKATVNAERMKINKLIKEAKAELNSEEF